MNDNPQQHWEHYCTGELSALRPLLQRHGYSLSEEQPHLKGERFLQQAVTTKSGKKLILYGNLADGSRVVIKATRERAGIAELVHERSCRKLLESIDFAADIFHTPREIAWIEEDGFVISIQEYIDQPLPFIERPLQEQFMYALAAFKAQEGAHATTFKHRRLIRTAYELRGARQYERNAADFLRHVRELATDDLALHELLARTNAILSAETVRIEQYCGFLTHTDFVPHNIRIDADGTMYLLDHSSLAFGNKYEGWARFLNFMTLYNPPLAQALTAYVRDNRSEEESQALWLMRLYRLSEIIFYYVKASRGSTGDLEKLNRARIGFWSTVLTCVLLRQDVPHNVITEYQTLRDSLRSPEEKERQKGLH